MLKYLSTFTKNRLNKSKTHFLKHGILIFTLYAIVVHYWMYAHTLYEKELLFPTTKSTVARHHHCGMEDPVFKLLSALYVVGIAIGIAPAFIRATF